MPYHTARSSHDIYLIPPLWTAVNIINTSHFVLPTRTLSDHPAYVAMRSSPGMPSHASTTLGASILSYLLSFSLFKWLLIVRASSNIDTNDTRLAQHVRKLPQEIWNQIYDHVFTAGPDIVYVDNTYRPPHLLQVNSESRKRFQHSYYNKTTFLFDSNRTLRKWHSSKTRQERDLIGYSVYMSSVRLSGRDLVSGALEEMDRHAVKTQLREGHGDVEVRMVLRRR